MKRDGMKTMTAVMALGACTLFARDAQFADAPYMNPRLSTEERMNDLISKMEMREKVAVLCTTAGFKMYEIRDVIFSVARPLWELRGFKRVTLDPGESATVSFELGEKELGFWNREGRFVVEPGDFKVAVWNGFTPGALARNSVIYKVGK